MPYRQLWSGCRTPPGVRELKHTFSRVLSVRDSRTPPGVRELKPDSDYSGVGMSSRTPPGVRELKHDGFERSLK